MRARVTLRAGGPSPPGSKSYASKRALGPEIVVLMRIACPATLAALVESGAKLRAGPYECDQISRPFHPLRLPGQRASLLDVVFEAVKPAVEPLRTLAGHCEVCREQLRLPLRPHPRRGVAVTACHRRGASQPTFDPVTAQPITGGAGSTRAVRAVALAPLRARPACSTGEALLPRRPE